MRPSFRRVWRTFITNSIRLLVNQTCAVCLCGLSAPRAIGKEPMLLILETLWALSSSFPYVSLYITWNPFLSLTHCICISAQCSTRERKNPVPQSQLWPLGRLEPLLLASTFLGNTRRRGFVILLAFTSSCCVISELFSLKMIRCKGLRWTRQLEMHLI